MQPPSSSQAATQAAFLTGLSPVPPEGGARAGTPGRMPDGRGVTITTTADHLQPPPARPPARAPERPPKRHHSEMAPTQEAPLPEPDRKARTESPRSPRPNRPPGPAVIDHVFTHSTYATIRLDLLPCVVGQAAQAALMSSLEPQQRELAGRELARRLGRQAETREVQGRLFRQLHGLLATTKEQASTPGARACVAHFLRGMASERAGTAQERMQLLARFFGQAMGRMPHPVVNLEEDLQAALDVVGKAAEGTDLSTPPLLASMLGETLALLAGPRWECRVSPDAWACQLLAGKLGEAGREDAGTRPALVRVLAESGQPLEAHTLGCLVAGLGETTPAQALDDLRTFLEAPDLSPQQQGVAVWGLACGLVAGPAGPAQPIAAHAAHLLVGAGEAGGQSVVDRLIDLAAPGGTDLQLRLLRALLEARREAHSALQEDFKARRANAQRQGTAFDRSATPLHRIDVALAAAVRDVADRCPRLSLFELLARYARATGVKASTLDSKAPADARRADMLAGLRLDPTDPAELAAFKGLPVTDRIALMESLGLRVAVRDRDELGERIARFLRAKADPALRIALLTRLFQAHAAWAGPSQLRAVREALVEDLQALGGPGLQQGVREHLGDLYTTWRQAQGLATWLDEGLPVPSDDRHAVRKVRDALARELQELAAVPGLEGEACDGVLASLTADLARLDAALKAPPPGVDD